MGAYPDTHRRFVDTGLKRTSTLKAEKIAVVHESVLVRRLGQLPMSLWLESQQALKLALRLP